MSSPNTASVSNEIPCGVLFRSTNELARKEASFLFCPPNNWATKVRSSVDQQGFAKNPTNLVGGSVQRRRNVGHGNRPHIHAPNSPKTNFQTREHISAKRLALTYPVDGL